MPPREPTQARGLRWSLWGLVAIVLVTGAAMAWWEVKLYDRRAEADQIQGAQLLTQALSLAPIANVEGDTTGKLLDVAALQRLREWLQAFRQLNPESRGIALLGLRSVDSVFNWVSVVQDPSRLGETAPPLGRDSANIRRAFGEGEPSRGLPYPGREGPLVSIYVPVYRDFSAEYRHTTPADAADLVQQALAFYRENGRGRLLSECSKPEGRFRRGELYAFVYDTSMTILAHPTRPELIGQNLLDRLDRAGGKPVRTATAGSITSTRTPRHTGAKPRPPTSSRRTVSSFAREPIGDVARSRRSCVWMSLPTRGTLAGQWRPFQPWQLLGCWSGCCWRARFCLGGCSRMEVGPSHGNGS